MVTWYPGFLCSWYKYNFKNYFINYFLLFTPINAQYINSNVYFVKYLHYERDITVNLLCIFGLNNKLYKVHGTYIKIIFICFMTLYRLSKLAQAVMLLSCIGNTLFQILTRILFSQFSCHSSKC
jgi:hypothetical protein